VSQEETLIRIEYKLDLIISHLQLGMGCSVPMLGPGDIPQLKGVEADGCPVCGQPIKINANYATESIERVCGCTPPVRIVPGISKLTKPPEASNGSRTGKPEDAVPPDEETSSPSGS
jgi:hypothetical protein